MYDNTGFKQQLDRDMENTEWMKEDKSNDPTYAQLMTAYSICLLAESISDTGEGIMLAIERFALAYEDAARKAK